LENNDLEFETSDVGLQKRLAASGAWLFAVGMVTGLWTAAALTDTVRVAIPHLALAAHLNALLGGFWLIIVAWTFQFLHYTARGLRRLSLLVQIPAWGNWFITLIASFLGVNGLKYNDPMAHNATTNNIIAFLLQLFVVLPTLVGAFAWAWGFRRKKNF
jgi:hydroxylaminobenzene mutase